MKTWRPEPGMAFIHPYALSAADLLAMIDTLDLSLTRKRDLRSAVGLVARELGKSPDRLPLDPLWLRPRLEAIAPAALGVSGKTWQNRVSDFRVAMKRVGIGGRLDPIPLTGQCERLRLLMRAHGDRGIICWLGKFLRFLYVTNTDITAVTHETILAYEAELRAELVNTTPAKASYFAARMWNKAADTIPGWPQNRIVWADRRNIYCLPWTAFPASLEADIEGWLNTGAGDDIFADPGPAQGRKPVTREKRRYELQRFASALVHAGIDASALTSIAVLVDKSNIATGLRWLRDNRFGGELTGGLQNIAIALATAARRHARVDPEHQATLDSIARQCGASERGMTLKNRLRMEPFKDPATLRSYLDLPEKITVVAVNTKNAERAAATAETALVIAILTWCPIRVGNLREIDLDRHLRREVRGRQQRVYLVVPGQQVKNNVDILFELPPPVVELLDRFVDDFRPRLAPSGSRFLFARRSGDAPLDYGSLARRVKQAFRDHLGVTFTSHNFRHLAGLIWLMENPTGFEVVRRLLGHKAASTAMDHYVGLQTDVAHQAFSELLARRREAAGG